MDQIYYLFSKYYHNILIKALKTDNPNTVELLNKKFIHTFRVINNVKTICYEEKLDSRKLFLSEISALFHDIGRFKQALDFGHFNDLKSFDHAEESANIFTSYKDYLLNILKEEDIIKIEKSIRYHNKISIKEKEDPEVILLTKILKDADKINILSINLKSNFMPFDGMLSSKEIINRSCIESFIKGEVVKNKDVESIFDNKVKLISWIYDLNFKASLRMYRNEKFIDILTDTSYTKNLELNTQLIDLKEIAINYIEYKTR